MHKNFYNFLKESKQEKIILSEVRPNVADMFYNYLILKLEFKVNYAIRHLYYLNRILKYALRLELIDSNPLAGYEYPRKAKKTPVYLEVPELQLFETTRL